jgi:hypothetical protein
MRVSIQLRSLAIALLRAGAAAAIECPPGAPTSIPVWIDVVSNKLDGAGYPATSFAFSGLDRDPRKRGQTLPFTVYTPATAIGGYDTDKFPGGPPFYSNASGDSIDCLPGIDPALYVTSPGRPARTTPGCPTGQVGGGCAPGGDCTGRPILRTPSSGIVSAFENGITGIDYLGTFEGASDTPSGGIVQVVFFHQNADYLAQAEYGFYRDPSMPNQLTYYWQTNANCTLRPAMGPNDTMCTTLQGDRQPATYLYTDGLVPPGNPDGITAGCNVDLGPAGGFGLYYYSMWIYADGGTLKFGMSILDPATLAPVVPAMSIDPNTGVAAPWFPIAELNGTGGYVTAGISRYDPLNTQTFSFAMPSMSIQRLVVGNAPH